MIYFDNNATTRVAPEVFDAMRPFLEGSFGNPSSGHASGREARRAVTAAREQVAALLGAYDPNEIVFTSGGTESDNTAILGALEAASDRKIVTTSVEHEAVRNLCRKLETQGCEVIWIEVDNEGSLDIDAFTAALDDKTAVVSVMMANNETGILFPVADLGRIVKERSNALFHVDGVNAVGKVPIDLKNAAIDLFSISGHKFHAPKGVGALYVRNEVDLPSMQIGGGQESGRRAGTEAVHQIAGLGRAAQLVMDLSPMERVRKLRDRLETQILKRVPNSQINGTSDPTRRLPNTSSISFENTNGEMIMAGLDSSGICVSTGSACNDQHHRASAVLEAMDVPYSWAMGSIRFSLGRNNTDEEVDRVAAAVDAVVTDLRQIG